MPRPDLDQIKWARAQQKWIRRRGEAIDLLTRIESLLDTILISGFIKPEYQPRFYGILIWEDFRLSTKVRLFRQIDLPEELQAKQKGIARTLEEKLLPTRNRFAHRQSVILTHKGVTVASLIDKGYKLSEITDKDFKAFRKECGRVTRMLQDVLLSLL